jgi:hypothetical protein
VTQVSATTADWLRSEGLRVVADAALGEGWGSQGAVSNISSPLAESDAAQAELDRQMVFLAGARVVDAIRVEGRRVDLIGRAVPITCAAEGYRTGAVVFVIGAREIEGEAATQLRVIRRLA